MAGPVDLLVRLLGDNEGAVRAVRQVGEEVDRTDTKVQESSGRLQKWGSALGAAVAGIGSIAGGFQAGQWFDQLTGAPQKLADAMQRVQMPTSGADLASSILAAGAQTANSAAGTPSGLLRQLGDYFTGKSGLNPFGGTLYDRERQALEIFRQQVLSDPALAFQALQSGGFGAQTPQFQQVYSQWAARQRGSQLYTGRIDQAAAQVNMYITAGVGDPRAIGADVQSSLDAFYRLNPHLVQTYPVAGPG
jgi:hypothetical protein